MTPRSKLPLLALALSLTAFALVTPAEAGLREDFESDAVTVLTRDGLRKAPESSRFLSVRALGDGDIGALARFPALTGLEVKFAGKLTTAAYKAFAKMKTLRYLELTGARGFDDAAIKALAGSGSLEVLIVRSPGKTSSNGWAELDGAKELVDLELVGLPFGAGADMSLGFVKAVCGAPKLAALRLSNGSGMTMESSSVLAGKSTLTVLELNNVKGFGDSCLEILQSRPLTRLGLSRTDITPAGLATLPKMASLRALTLAGKSGFGDEALATVAGCAWIVCRSRSS